MTEATQAHRGDARGNGCIPDAAGTVNEAAWVPLRGTLSAALHLAAAQSWTDRWLVHLCRGPPQAERLVRVHALSLQGEDMIVTMRQHHMHDHLLMCVTTLVFLFVPFLALCCLTMAAAEDRVCTGSSHYGHMPHTACGMFSFELDSFA